MKEQEEGEKKGESLADLVEHVEVPVNEKFNKKTNCYSIKKITSNKHNNFQKDINDFAELCSELKLLYTAITRPRKTLIIFDDGDCPARGSVERLW